MFGFLKRLFGKGGSPRNAYVDLLCDKNSFEELFAGLVPEDPLEFPGYAGKLEAALAEHPSEGILTGIAKIGGRETGLGVMETGFVMGSMGSVVGEKIARLAEECTTRRLPLVLVVRSGGARMQEGLFSLMQMAKTSAAIRRHGDAGLLYVSVLAYPTTGGVAASFAMQADVVLAEPDALIAFAGPRVIEQVMKQKLPEGFQSAQFTLEHGFVDRIAPREELRGLLSAILDLHGEAV